MTTRKKTGRTLIAAAALCLLALGAPAQPAAASGIRNCVDVTGKQIGRVGCFEKVWANGSEYRMTFSNQGFSGATPQDLARFYVLAPQSERAQGFISWFPHDHVVDAVPAGNGGSYTVKLAGFFVFCTGEGMASGACVPLWTSPAGPPLPFAQTVVGGPLTSTEAIEAAADAGYVALVDLGPNAVIVGSIGKAD